jgi:hypothetical protein
MIGASIGLFAAALCVAASRADEEEFSVQTKRVEGKHNSLQRASHAFR